MTLAARLRSLFSFKKHFKPKQNFIYPHSENGQLKRDEIWQNLQKGVLLEDKHLLIPWLSPFNELYGLAEQRRERADRTELDLGKRSILAGYEASLELVRWKYKEGDELVKQVSENLGLNEEGEQRFNHLKQYMMDLLGEPTNVDLEKFGSLDTGTIGWEKGGVALTLVGIEHFNVRYTFYIGLKSEAKV